MDTDESHQLKRLYTSIQACHICPKMKCEKALRRVEAVDPRTDVMIVSQALAEAQLRETGVNFFGLDAKPGRSGRILEQFLNKFERTIYPGLPIPLDNGKIIPACEPGRIPVYNSEITQCFPGKASNRKGDRKPGLKEIRECHARGFLLEEIDIIRPKLIILQGGVTHRGFYELYLREEHPKGLQRQIEDILRQKCVPRYTVGSVTTHVLTMMHAASRGKPIWEFIKNETLIDLIKDILD